MVYVASARCCCQLLAIKGIQKRTPNEILAYLLKGARSHGAVRFSHSGTHPRGRLSSAAGGESAIVLVLICTCSITAMIVCIFEHVQCRWALNE
jgi:hypothetical protein